MADDISLFQEIDDSLRAEKLEQFWKRFGNWVLMGCIAIVLCTIVWVVWKNHMREVSMRETDALLHAETLMAAGNYTDAAKALEDQEKTHGGLAMLAGILRAQALMSAGQKDKAQAAFAAVAGKPAETALSDFANVQAHALAGDVPNVAKNSPYAPAAEMMKAVQLMDAGKNKEAQPLLSGIAENDALLPTERARALDLEDRAGEGTK